MGGALYTLLFRPSKNDRSLTAVYSSEEGGGPIYTVDVIDNGNVVLYCSGCVIGTASIPSHQASIKLTLFGAPVSMETNRLVDGYSVQHPSKGRLNWRPDDLTGATLNLTDRNGSTVARLISTLGKCKLEIFTPSDQRFTPFVLLSAVATNKALNRK